MKQKKGIALTEAFPAVLTLVLVAVLVIIAIFLFTTLGSTFTPSSSADNATDSMIVQFATYPALVGLVKFPALKRRNSLLHKSEYRLKSGVIKNPDKTRGDSKNIFELALETDKEFLTLRKERMIYSPNTYYIQNKWLT